MAEEQKILPSTISIHQITQEQWRDYEFLKHEMLKDNSLELDPLELEDLHNSENEWRQRINEGIIIVAYDKISPIGIIRSKFQDNKSEIHELYVKEGYKELGLEEKLIVEVVGKIEDARRVRVIEVLIIKNSSNIEIYKALGFFEDELNTKIKENYLILKKPL